MKQNESITLASQSPRRRELLSAAGLVFGVEAADIDETCVPYTGDPAQFVKDLSMRKAEAVVPGQKADWIIGADTIVVQDEKILGKPRDRQEAESMLYTLSNRTHSVFTGYTVMNPSRGQTTCAFVETKVLFKHLCSGEISWYADTGQPYDKAGGYGIQGIGAFLVRKITGSYTNVVGLPVCEVMDTLTSYNIITY